MIVLSLFGSVYLFSSSLTKILEAQKLNKLLVKNEVQRMFEVTNNNVFIFNGIFLVVSGCSVITIIFLHLLTFQTLNKIEVSLILHIPINNPHRATRNISPTSLFLNFYVN